MKKLLSKIKPTRKFWLTLLTLFILGALVWVSVLSLRFLITSITSALQDPVARPENVVHFNADGFKELGL